METQTGHAIPSSLPYITPKKRTRRIVKFVIPTDHREKVKESEKREKYFKVAREPRKVLNIGMAVILIVSDALRFVLSGHGNGTKRVGN